MLAKPEKVILLTVSRAGKQADSDIGKHITATCGLTRAKLVYRESSRRAAPAKLYTLHSFPHRLLTDPQSRWFKYPDFS